MIGEWKMFCSAPYFIYWNGLWTAMNKQYANGFFFWHQQLYIYAVLKGVCCRCQYHPLRTLLPASCYDVLSWTHGYAWLHSYADDSDDWWGNAAYWGQSIWYNSNNTNQPGSDHISPQNTQAIGSVSWLWVCDMCPRRHTGVTDGLTLTFLSIVTTK